MMPLTGIGGTDPGQHEFDAVSKDGSTIAAIKGHSFKTAGGNLLVKQKPRLRSIWDPRLSEAGQ
jgi:hypothetical protein